MNAMVQRVDPSNALQHCQVLHKVLMNAAMLSKMSGANKTRWSVSEMAWVFDLAWGRHWPYSSPDIVRLMKTLQDGGFIQIETGFLGRIKSYSLSGASLELLNSIDGAPEEAERTEERSSVATKSFEYSRAIDSVVALAASKSSPFDAIMPRMGDPGRVMIFEKAIREMLRKRPDDRMSAEKITADLIEAGADPVCAIAALSNIFAKAQSDGSREIYRKSTLQIRKELEELGSVGSAIENLRAFQDPNNDKWTEAIAPSQLKIQKAAPSAPNWMSNLDLRNVEEFLLNITISGPDRSKAMLHIKRVATYLDSPDRFAMDEFDSDIRATFYLVGMQQRQRDNFATQFQTLGESLVELGARDEAKLRGSAGFIKTLRLR